MKRTSRAAVAGALAASLTFGTAWATAVTLDELQAGGVVTDISAPDFTGPDSLQGLLPAGDLAMLVTSGTTDAPVQSWGTTYHANRTAYQVHYPQSFWPIIASVSPDAGLGRFLGLFAPTYSSSTNTGTRNNLRAMEAIAGDPAFDGRTIILLGFSQGSESSGNAYEEAIEDGTVGDHSSAAVLLSDPRSPWGVKAWLDGRPLLRYLGAPLLGIKADGARDPEKITDGHHMTQVIVVGDPIGNMQWKFLRPVSSAIVVVTGWSTMHMGNNPWSTPSLFRRTAENTEGLDGPLVLTSENGNVTYMIYDSYHPTAVQQAQFEYDLGLLDSEAEFVARVQKLDPKYQKWFAIEKPAVDNAAVPVTTRPSPPVVPEGEIPVVVDTDPETGEVPEEVVVVVDGGAPAAIVAVPTETETETDPEIEVVPTVEPEPVQEASESEVSPEEFAPAPESDDGGASAVTDEGEDEEKDES